MSSWWSVWSWNSEPATGQVGVLGVDPGGGRLPAVVPVDRGGGEGHEVRQVEGGLEDLARAGRCCAAGRPGCGPASARPKSPSAGSSPARHIVARASARLRSAGSWTTVKWAVRSWRDGSEVPQVPGRREADVLQVAVGDDPPPAVAPEERVVEAVDRVDGVDAGEAVTGLDRRQEDVVGGVPGGQAGGQVGNLVGAQPPARDLASGSDRSPSKRRPWAVLELRGGRRVDGVEERGPVAGPQRSLPLVEDGLDGVALACGAGPRPAPGVPATRLVTTTTAAAAALRMFTPPATGTVRSTPTSRASSSSTPGAVRVGHRRRGWPRPGRRARRGRRGRRGRRRGRPGPGRRTAAGRRRPGTPGRRRVGGGQQAAEQGVALVEVGRRTTRSRPGSGGACRARRIARGSATLSRSRHEHQVAQRLATSSRPRRRPSPSASSSGPAARR